MKKLAFYLCCALVLISCDSSDDTNLIPAELSGKWELQNVSCFCFYPEDFNFSVHTINFNSIQSIVTIENSQETLFIAASGNYDFQVRGNKITINGAGQYSFEINGDSLELSFVDNPEIADDEINLSYKKM